MENVPENDGSSSSANPGKLKRWLKRIGLAGFLFFLLKGIGWLVLFYLMGKGLVDENSWVYRIFH